MLVGRRFQVAPSVDVAVGGAALLALGLAGLAMIPGAQPFMAAVAFAVCGAGFDLVHEVLDGAAVPADGPAVRASAVSIGARHAGLVLGLALIAPVLSSSLECRHRAGDARRHPHDADHRPRPVATRSR